MLTSLGKLSTESQAIQEQIHKLAESKLMPALKEAWTDLKKAVPTLEAVRWEQYTPYFNDGETCTFSLHGVHFKLNSVKEGAKADYDDDFFDSYSIKNVGLTESQVEVLQSFEEELGHLEELLEEAIGDHMQVTLNAEGIETEEYSHD